MILDFGVLAAPPRTCRWFLRGTSCTSWNPQRALRFGSGEVLKILCRSFQIYRRFLIVDKRHESSGGKREIFISSSGRREKVKSEITNLILHSMRAFIQQLMRATIPVENFMQAFAKSLPALLHVLFVLLLSSQFLDELLLRRGTLRIIRWHFFRLLLENHFSTRALQMNMKRERKKISPTSSRYFCCSVANSRFYVGGFESYGNPRLKRRKASTAKNCSVRDENEMLE